MEKFTELIAIRIHSQMKIGIRPSELHQKLVNYNVLPEDFNKNKLSFSLFPKVPQEKLHQEDIFPIALIVLMVKLRLYHF